jgi:hypothetical protein
MSYADNPIATLEQEWLSRQSSVDTLVDVLSAEDLETSLVVGIYGCLGQRQDQHHAAAARGLHKRLRDDKMERHGNRSGEHALSLWFDAWKYARQDTALWRAPLLGSSQRVEQREGRGAKLLQPDHQKTKLKKGVSGSASASIAARRSPNWTTLRSTWGRRCRSRLTSRCALLTGSHRATRRRRTVSPEGTAPRSDAISFAGSGNTGDFTLGAGLPSRWAIV